MAAATRRPLRFARWIRTAARTGASAIFGRERRLERRSHSRVGGRHGQTLVGDELRLHDNVDRAVDRLDLVRDRDDGPLRERNKSYGLDADGATRGRHPLGAPTQRARTEVEDSLVPSQFAVTHVERFVVNEQSKELSVGDVDEGLPRPRKSVPGFSVGLRSELVEAVEVRPRQSVRFSLVQVSAPSDVAVGQRKQRLALGEHVEVKLGFAERPRLDAERRVADHSASRSSARSVTTRSAPCRRSSTAWPTRSTPTTKPKCPARPASTPASASSNTAE